MSTASFEVSDVIPATPAAVYKAWLDGDGHGAMIGAEATGKAKVGAEFTAWDGYISGKNIELEPGERIVQTWRTSQFEEEHADSRLEILLEEADGGGTKITIKHSNLPEDQADNYKQGWTDHYFTPMKAHFGG